MYNSIYGRFAQKYLGGLIMKETVRVTDPVEIHWKDRSMTCQPWVISNSDEILLGAIPLEDMDLIIDPLRETLIGAHGDKPLYRI